jgi:hypothetical protein
MTPEEYREALSGGFGQARALIGWLVVIVMTALLVAGAAWTARSWIPAAVGVANRVLAFAPARGQRPAGVAGATRRVVGWVIGWLLAGVAVGVLAVWAAVDPSPDRLRGRALRAAMRRPLRRWRVGGRMAPRSAAQRPCPLRLRTGDHPCGPRVPVFHMRERTTMQPLRGF